MNALLSSMFGPYVVNDACGRTENTMELLHNLLVRLGGILDKVNVRVFVRMIRR